MTEHHCSPPPTRILLVDDHGIVRQGLRAMLDLEHDMVVVGEAASADEAVAAVVKARPDVVLLDLKLGEGEPPEGLEVCSRIVARHPATGVVVLTTFLDQPLVLEAIRRGARGYVLKDVDVVDLVRIIRAVRRGDSGFDARSAAMVVRSLAAGTPAPGPPQLSNREVEIVRLIARGLTNREIGERTFLSESTVKFHLRNAMQKLGVHHRAGVVYEAGKRGLL